MSTFSKLLKNCIFVSYTSGGSGNAFSRILYIHEEFFYWNILFNPWYIHDTNCKKSLDWIETQEHTDIMKDKKVYTPTHLDLRPIQNISPIEGETEAEFKNYIYNHANKQLIIDFIKSNKKVILPNHTTTNNLLKNFPANTIINLYSNKKESIKNHRGWPPTPRALSQKYYWEIMQWFFYQISQVGPFLGQAHQFLYYHKGQSLFAEKKYKDYVKRVYDTLDKRLEENEFLGVKYSIADIATWPWIARFEIHQTNLKKYNNILRWYKIIAKRTAVIKGYHLDKEDNEIPQP